MTRFVMSEMWVCDGVMVVGYYMKGMRNKRFTTLQSLSYTLHHSLEKAYRSK